jgi:pimeloyl-ACP methyl ester carboxylesterase
MQAGLDNETFDGTFPFKPNFTLINGFRMHYVDEGQGEPIIFCHGEPTWGYLYRKFIPPLSRTNRVIVPDAMGFGKSDTPQDKEYMLETHIENLRDLVRHLDLRDITLGGQDWGGPVMFGLATREPDRVKRIIIMNTALGVAPEGARLWYTPMLERGVFYDFMGNLSQNIRILMGNTIQRDEAKTETLFRAYAAPFPDTDACKGAIAWPLDIPAGDHHRSAPTMHGIIEKLPLLKDKPKVIIWGLKDPVFSQTVVDWWLRVYPNTPVHRLDNASHFLQEDEPEAIVKLIQEFLEHNP